MKKNIPKFDYRKINEKILEDLSPKQREVLKRRSGILTGQKETLEAIGQKFGLTRERVRQIEEYSFNSLRKSKKISLLDKLGEKIFSYFNFYGKARREEDFLSDFGQENKPYLTLILNLHPKFTYFPYHPKLYPFWVSERKVFPKVEKFNDFLVRRMNKVSQPLSGKDLKDVHQKEAPKVLKEKISENTFFSYISISREILKGPLGKFGLTHWPEINPRGVKDEAYLVLKKEGTSLHFRDITKKISEIREKETNPQTVHNELIKDPKFVLIGRGIYGISEWGFRPGTVRDVIRDTLKEKQPLSEKEIIQEVLKQRLVKENTISLNLKDKNFFSRNNKGKYILA